MSKKPNAGDDGADLGDMRSRTESRTESTTESTIPLLNAAPERVLLEDMLSVARSVG